jgi:hypothetical protein
LLEIAKHYHLAIFHWKRHEGSMNHLRFFHPGDSTDPIRINHVRKLDSARNVDKARLTFSDAS